MNSKIMNTVPTDAKTIDLSPARWAQVEALFDQAADLPAEKRDAYLAEACDADLELRSYILSLLDSDIASEEAISDMIVGALKLVDADAFVEQRDFSGDRIGPYQIIRELGSGGMGVVYLAERADDQFEQQVAIKLVRQRLLDPMVESRLMAERQILANLDNPNIARLLDGGTTADGTPYLVMEYIDGVPIDIYCDSNRLNIDERLQLFRVICDAVHYAHQNLVVHRDIKPSNILVTKDGMLKLLDFGIAKLIDTSGTATDGLTRQGLAMMTPGNAAPEQVLGDPITTATDTYALGVLLYTLLTGYPPLAVRNVQQGKIARIIIEQVPERPSRRIAMEKLRTRTAADGAPSIQEVSRDRRTSVERLQRRLRGDLDNILLTALRKEPKRRYHSANAFAEDVRFHLQSLPVSARADTWTYRSVKFVRRRYAIVITSALVMLMVLGFGIVTSIQNKRIALERDTAQAVSKFLEEIFMEPDPARARGLDITAKEILSNGARRIQQQLADRPDIQSALMETIGRVYLNLGEYGTSVDMQEGSLRIRREMFGDKGVVVAASKNELALSLIKQGEFERARRLLEEALRQNRDSLAAVSAPIAANLYNLAELHLSIGNLDEAEQFATECISVYSQLGEKQALKLAEAKSLLARIFQVTGDLAQTEQLLREAIAIVQSSVGTDHPHMAYYLQNLAVLLQSKGDIEGAEGLLHQSIEVTRRILGNEHDLLGTSYVMLGSLLHERGEYVAAEDALRMALRIHTNARGPTHPYVGYDMTNIGMLLHDMGRLAEAEESLRGALDIYQQSLGATHQYVGSTLTALGAVLNSSGSAAEAEPLLQRAIEIRRQDYSFDSPLAAATSAVYADTLSRLGRYDAAEVLLLKSIDVLRRKKGRRYQQSLEAAVRLYDGWGKADIASTFRQELNVSILELESAGLPEGSP